VAAIYGPSAAVGDLWSLSVLSGAQKKKTQILVLASQKVMQQKALNPLFPLVQKSAQTVKN